MKRHFKIEVNNSTSWLVLLMLLSLVVVFIVFLGVIGFFSLLGGAFLGITLFFWKIGKRFFSKSPASTPEDPASSPSAASSFFASQTLVRRDAEDAVITSVKNKEEPKSQEDQSDKKE